METIKLYKDGNKMCASIGSDDEKGVVAFGDTMKEAVINLFESITNHRHILNQSADPKYHHADFIQLERRIARLEKESPNTHGEYVAD